MTALSLVDQGPVSAETPPSQTLLHTVALAQLADEVGLTRYWLAEHHGVRNMGVAAPEILIGHIASRTTRLRVGAGGIMLPNHAPLHVAEQFRTLEALHPGRIDLGIGRSTGTGDEATRNALLRTPDGLERFGHHLTQLLGVGGRGGLDPADPYAGLVASPWDVPLPAVFLLGSSTGSAEAAARAGLGYAYFSVYQAPEAAATALRRYRELFTPHRPEDRPHAIVAARIWVGEDAEHAHALASSERLAVLDFLTGTPAPLEPMERALARPLTEAQLAVRDRLDTRSDVVGDVDHVAARLADLVAATGADEVMAVSNIHDPLERRNSLRRLAAAVEPHPVPVG
ncbi:LLM class flavin-dependent oxidoreductase [Saccharothrix syringae]|uniref:LLM class flavin-dependent oxidoreductase n=1 Tax=Saccharothrix syringae TaxID=103733 RepID=A0A5Q0H0L7_SACSY|nr:LLM class flavin-dependent oxidoreductase [Saccharothrix syringae]QFZ19202.1 LLM class flavin-dependent oxidoreductase [Saccharothrix syringae]